MNQTKFKNGNSYLSVVGIVIFFYVFIAVEIKAICFYTGSD